MNPNLSDELYHYGVLGMKWGVRRSQEELGHKPSSKKKISKIEQVKAKLAKKAAKTRAEAAVRKKAAEEKRRKEILNDPSKLYKHRKEFSKEEIDKAIAQFKWEQELNKLGLENIKIGQEKVAKGLGLLTTGIGYYNQVAAVVNSFVDDVNLPYVQDPKQGKKKDDKKKD